MAKIQSMECVRPEFETDSQLAKIKLLEKGEKPYKLNDKKSDLYVAVGRTCLTFRYVFTLNGITKSLTIGKYKKEVTLAEARQRLKEARAMIAQGLDPALAKQQNKQAQIEAKKEAEKEAQAKVQTFEKTAKEFLNIWEHDKRSRTVYSKTNMVNKHLLPALGQKPIVSIEQNDIITLLNGLKSLPVVYSSALGLLKKIFRYAIARQYIDKDPLTNINTVLPKIEAETKHLSAVTDIAEIGPMLNKLDEYMHNNSTKSLYLKLAVKLLRYLPLRPGELVNLEWTDVDLEHAEIHLSKAKTKTKIDATFYLSDQAIEILYCAKEIAISKYVFDSSRSSGVFCKKTLSNVLKDAGLKNIQTLHGFRAVFSSLVNAVNPNANLLVESYLTHKTQNNVAAAYNRTNYEKQKRLLIQWYADAIDCLIAGETLPKFNQEILGL